MSEQKLGDEKVDFIQSIRSAYDLSSAGMGVVLHSVRKLDLGENLSEWESESIDRFGSNYIVQPYILFWLRPERLGDFLYGSVVKNQSDLAEKHKELILTAEERYDYLKWNIFRMTLANEDSDTFKQSGQPFSKKELLAFLKRGVKNGMIEGDSNSIEKILPADSETSLTRNIYKARVDLTDRFFEEYRRLFFTDRYKKQLLTCATLKLGSMLAVTDLIASDASKSGTPIPYSFKPPLFDKGWKEAFNKPVPCIGDLYKEAYSVFCSVAEPKDPLIAHLFSLKELSFA